MREGVTTEQIDAWLAEIDDTLDWGITFRWELSDFTDEDLTMTDHQGQEAMWVQG